jgi:hypothetical protein
VNHVDDDPFRTLRTWFRHWPPLLLTLASVALATLVRLGFDEVWPDRYPFLPYFPAILLCAMVAGWRYGALATAVSALLSLVLTEHDSDLAAVTGLIKCVFERDALDHAFIDAHTAGVDALRTAVDAASWAAIEAGSGLARAQIEQAADVYCASDATIFCWGMGITQHARSVATIQMLLNALLLRGNIGRPGAGPCPVRGHSTGLRTTVTGTVGGRCGRVMFRLKSDTATKQAACDGTRSR